MNINFANTERPMVYALELITDYSANTVIQDLEQENWQVESFKNVSGRNGGRRYTINGAGRYASEASIDSLSSPILQDLLIYTLSNDFKTKWLGTMVENLDFCKLWGTSNIKELSSFTLIQANYILDNTMAKIGLHLDNRLLVATGMIYLNDLEPEIRSQQATTFYTDQNKSNPLTITPGFGTGWAAANTHNSWHEGYNLSTQKRYSLLLGMSIDVGRLQAL